MDKVVRFIDEIDVEKKTYHAQQIDRLRNAMNMAMIKSRKDKKERKKNKWIKMKENYDSGNKG